MNPWLLFLSYSISNSVSLNTGPLRTGGQLEARQCSLGLSKLKLHRIYNKGYLVKPLWNRTLGAQLICCKAVTLPLAQHNTSRSETPLQYLAAPFKSLMYVLHDFTFSL